MWRTGALETIGNIVEDGLRHARVGRPLEELQRRFSDLLDGAIELGVKPLGRPLWSEMKENARLASESETGGARLAASEISTLVGSHPGVSVHLAGHSAGAIFMAYLVELLRGAGVPIGSLSLMAPACTTDLFEAKVAPHLGNEIANFALFNLGDEAERGDNVGPYRKSLLYLVSNAFEDSRGTRLLGIEAQLAKARGLARRLGSAKDSEKARIRDVGLSRRTLISKAERHAAFDNDEHTLNSILRVVLDSNRIQQPFD